jgi:hypothetical protein
MHLGRRRETRDWTRRRFLLTAGSLAALTGAEVNAIAASAKRGVCIVIDPTDTVASSSVSLWAAEELEKAQVHTASLHCAASA